MRPVTLPTTHGSYEVLAALAPHAHRYLGIGVQDGGCVMHVVGSNPSIERLVLCDTWGPHHGGTNRGSHDYVAARLNGFHGSVLFLDGPSQVLIPKLDEHFDLAYVDGDHGEEPALADFKNTWRILDGAMVVHDIRMPPVWTALMRFLDQTGNATAGFCSGGHGTAIIYRREAP